MWREARCPRPQSERRLCVTLSAGMLTDRIWKYNMIQMIQTDSKEVIMEVNRLHAQHLLDLIMALLDDNMWLFIGRQIVSTF